MLNKKLIVFTYMGYHTATMFQFLVQVVVCLTYLNNWERNIGMTLALCTPSAISSFLALYLYLCMYSTEQVASWA
jgi:hypothetical protein